MQIYLNPGFTYLKENFRNWCCPEIVISTEPDISQSVDTSLHSLSFLVPRAARRAAPIAPDICFAFSLALYIIRCIFKSSA